MFHLIKKLHPSILIKVFRNFIRGKNCESEIKPLDIVLFIFDRISKKNNFCKMDVIHGNIYGAFLSAGNHALI